jgi:hypothetical protein
MIRRAVLCLLACVWLPAAAAARERYALVISGASGGPQYAEKYDRWRDELVRTLRDIWEYPADHVTVLAETASEDARVATRDNVRAALAAFRTTVTADDTLLIVLIGHGAGEDEGAKFNLVGPDMSAREWADALAPLRGQLAFVNTASGSFPYLEVLAGRNRAIVTANDSAAQQFETVMPEYFIEALSSVVADTDKNGKTSLWEAFVYASAGVARWYEERGQLPTERPLLDDDGDGIGREPAGDGSDGLVAKTLYLEPEPVIPDSGNPEIDAMRRRRQTIEIELDRLKVRKEQMPPAQYEDALERLLLELARIDRRLRTGS